MPASPEWFVRRGRELRGPFTTDELRRLATNGKIRLDDGVRQGRDGAWIDAGTVPGLFVAPNDHQVPLRGNTSRSPRPAPSHPQTVAPVPPAAQGHSVGPPPLPPQFEVEQSPPGWSTFATRDSPGGSDETVAPEKALVIVLTALYSAIQALSYVTVFYAVTFALQLGGAILEIIAESDAIGTAGRDAFRQAQHTFSLGSILLGLLPFVALALALSHAAVCYGLFTKQRWSFLLTLIIYALTGAIGVLQILALSSAVLRVVQATQVAVAVAVIWYFRQPNVQSYFRQ